MKALDEKGRLRIVFLHGCGKNQEEIGQDLGVSRATVRKWLRRFKKTGLVKEGARSGRPRVTTIEQEEALMRALQEDPSRTVKTLCSEMGFPYVASLRRVNAAKKRQASAMKRRTVALQDQNPSQAVEETVEPENASQS